MSTWYAAGLGVVPVPQARFVGEIGDGMRRALGPQRSEWAYRHASLLAAGIAPEDLPIAAELGSLAAVKHLTALGFGYAIASHAAIRQEIAEGSLVSVPLAPKLYTPLEVIVLKDKFRSRLVNTFADFVTAEIVRLSSAFA